jgi:hypothetical protein
MISNVNSIHHVSIRRTLTTLQNLRFLRTTLAFCTTTLKAHPFQKGTLDTSCEKIYLSLSIFVSFCISVCMCLVSAFPMVPSVPLVSKFRGVRWFQCLGHVVASLLGIFSIPLHHLPVVVLQQFLLVLPVKSGLRTWNINVFSISLFSKKNRGLDEPISIHQPIPSV